MRNSRFWKSSLLFALCCVSFSLWGGAKEVEQQMQRVVTHVDEIAYQLNHHKVEIDLFQERLKGVEEGLQEGLQAFSKAQGKLVDSPKLRLLEEGQKALLADLKTLKGELVSCLARQAELEKSVQGQMKEVQQNLQKALQLLGGAVAESVYTVKTGDSLGLIAQRHKVSVKALRDTNHLTSDQIYVGQKLKLP